MPDPHPIPTPTLPLIDHGGASLYIRESEVNGVVFDAPHRFIILLKPGLAHERHIPHNSHNERVLREWAGVYPLTVNEGANRIS